MAGLGGTGSWRGRGSSSVGPALGGFVVGVVAGLAAPRLLHRVKENNTRVATKHTAGTKPAGGQILRLVPQPAMHGVVLASSSTLQLTRASTSKLSRQQGNTVFTGFRNWGVTTSYLSSGVGSFSLQGAGGPAFTNWQPADYRRFLGGQPLETPIHGGQIYTLYFQRKGQKAVDLGSFKLGPAIPQQHVKS